MLDPRSFVCLVCLTLLGGLTVACAGDDSASTAPETPGTAATAPEPTPHADPPGSTAGVAIEIEEAWTSRFDEADDVDSVAVWTGADDRTWVVATAKESHQLIVYDAATGEEIRRIGEAGDALGRYQRPNGIVILDDLVFVAERDNHRVQVLTLPHFLPLGAVGTETLIRPYGLTAVRGRELGRYDLYVTDNYETPEGETPADEILDERVKHYRVAVSRSGDGLAFGIDFELVRAFGEVEGPGVLRVVESIVADRAGGRLLIAEEQTGDWSAKVYDLSGGFTGTSVGRGDFGDEAEGIALYPCGDDGWWILTDQVKARTVFHVYERRSFERVGAFSGALTANTDGVALSRTAGPRFPQGAFFAVHDDQGVAAFDWRDVASALGLETCDAPVDD